MVASLEIHCVAFRCSQMPDRLGASTGEMLLSSFVMALQCQHVNTDSAENRHGSMAVTSVHRSFITISSRLHADYCRDPLKLLGKIFTEQKCGMTLFEHRCHARFDCLPAPT